MKKIIEKLFGKPYDNTMFKATYWSSVVFYMIGGILVIILNCIAFSKENLIISLISIVLYPILFRIVYYVNVYLYKVTAGASKRVD